MIDKIEEVSRFIFRYHTKELLGEKYIVPWEEAGEDTQVTYRKEAEGICQLMEAEMKDLKDCLDAARTAIADSICCEDGLDGQTGLEMINWICEVMDDSKEFYHEHREIAEYSK